MDATLWRDIEDELRDAKLAEDVERYVRAAFAQPGAVAEAINGVAPEPPPVDVSSVDGPKTWLRYIEVEGFRGVGPTARLELEPGPGLTVAQGRNGCGKSSLAEGLEVLLSGSSMRWEDRDNEKEWREGWAHLGWEGPIRVEAGVLVEGEGERSASKTWAERTESPEAAPLSPEGMGAELGWDQGVKDADPVLTYSELSQLPNAKGTKRFRQLAHLLGLDEVEDARKVLADHRLVVGKLGKELEEHVEAALVGLRALPDDERATAAIEALGDWKGDELEALRAHLATLDEQPTPPGSEPATLKQLAQLQLPTEADVDEAAEAVLEAVEALAALAGTSGSQSAELATLLEKALSLHDRTNAEDCAVCGAPLSAQWVTGARARMEEAQQASRTVRSAEATLKKATSDFQKLVAAPPACLGELEKLALPTEAAEAWGTWAAVREEPKPSLMASRGQAAAKALHPLLEALQREARTRLEALDSAWLRLRVKLDELVEEAGVSFPQARAAKPVDAAEKWVKKLQTRLRLRRLEPISEKAISIWETLRTDSGVSLEPLDLSGTARPALKLPAKVEGSDTNALAVMSQGELNALSLSLFLPRATVDSSPFRFVVIDDPVQAMDPHKVDGLARLLLGIAESRQVVVFTHDPRLWDAVQRAGEGATCWNVERHPGGRVEPTRYRDPVEVHLEEANRIISAKGKVDAKVCAAVVPGLCRLALDARLAQRIRRRELTRRSHREVEEMLDDARGTWYRLALDLCGNGKDLDGAASNLGPELELVVDNIVRGAHGELELDPARVLRDTRRLLKELPCKPANA